MKSRAGEKIFVSKEYSHAAGRLHLAFHQLHLFVVKDLQERIKLLQRSQQDRSVFVTFFKQVLFSSREEEHPLFKDRTFIKRIKRLVRRFEKAVRHFETTYIAMIKELSEKTAQTNLDIPFEESIVMQRREDQNAGVVSN